MAQSRKNLTDRRVAAETEGGSREAEKRRAAALRKQREAQLRQAQREEAQAKQAAEQEQRRAAAARQKARMEQEKQARQAQQRQAAASSSQAKPKQKSASAPPRQPQRQAQPGTASAQSRQAARPATGQRTRTAPQRPAGQQRPRQPQRQASNIRREPFLRVQDFPVQGKGRRRRYPPNSPAAIKRQKRIQRRLIMFCVALAVVAMAILLSTDVLFKVVNIRIETMERTVPANTGVYTESEIIAAAQIEEGAALFSVNPKKVRDQLLVSLPYLESAQVRFSLPTTVEIQVEPAVESLYVRSGSSYAILSRTFRVLKLDSTRPEGLVELRARVDGTPQVGYSLAFAQVDEEKDDEAATKAQKENESLAQTLETIVGYLQQEGIYAHVTQINLRDMADITLMFRDRVTVQLGTINNMDYKCRMLGNLIRNDDGSGINENDRGTLDVSRCASTGKAYFTPD